MAKEKKAADPKELSVEDKLKALYKLQTINSTIDEIKLLRGELPLEVQDLEDELAGIRTRIDNFNEDWEVELNTDNIRLDGAKSYIGIRNTFEYNRLKSDFDRN